eukprot:1142473-Pelagomonas_calceolata.AAC.15
MFGTVGCPHPMHILLSCNQALGWNGCSFNQALGVGTAAGVTKSWVGTAAVAPKPWVGTAAVAIRPWGLGRLQLQSGLGAWDGCSCNQALGVGTAAVATRPWVGMAAAAIRPWGLEWLTAGMPAHSQPSHSRCNVVGDQGGAPGFAAVRWHSGNIAVCETSKQAQDTGTGAAVVNDVSWICCMPAVCAQTSECRMSG